MAISLKEQELINALDEIKGSGKFLSAGSIPFVPPGLKIDGLEEICFPLNQSQIRDMIASAHQAPFGKGSKTILDTAIRKTWEIDAAQIRFDNPVWFSHIAKITTQAQKDLGIEHNKVEAHLYKLLIYEEGGFFLPHKDSEKEKGMFGTLVLGLPSVFSGGELHVGFGGDTEIVDFNKIGKPYEFPFAAFYADCKHEVKPVTSGYRVCLIYNLVQLDTHTRIELQSTDRNVDYIKRLLWSMEKDEQIPKIILLGHQYTPANFSLRSLKLNDSAKAHALVTAAGKAGYYIKFGLVTSYLVGELEPDYRTSRRRKRDYYDDFHLDDDMLQNGKMGEVYNASITVSHWADDETPPLEGIPVDSSYLLSSIHLNSGEPIEKEAEGYTGNAGMEMTYWYHYGAAFLWPRNRQPEILASRRPANKLQWIDYYNRHWENLDDDERTMVKEIVLGDWNEPERWEPTMHDLPSDLMQRLEALKKVPRLDLSPLVRWIINLKNPGFLTNEGSVLLSNLFEKISVEDWSKLFESYSAGNLEAIWERALQQAKSGSKEAIGTIRHYLEILAHSGLKRFPEFTQKQIADTPQILEKAHFSTSANSTELHKIVETLLQLSESFPQDDEWTTTTLSTLTRQCDRKYVDQTLAKAVLDFSGNTSLSQGLLTFCIENLRVRTGNEPEPPRDWARPLPDSFRKHHPDFWLALAGFMDSPVLRIFEYRKAQAERTALESAIYYYKLDLTGETIRKGSPHSLRLTKNTADYQRQYQQWNNEKTLLNQLLTKINDPVQ